MNIVAHLVNRHSPTRNGKQIRRTDVHSSNSSALAAQHIDPSEQAVAWAAMHTPDVLFGDGEVPDGIADDFRDELMALLVAIAYRRFLDGKATGGADIAAELVSSGSLSEKCGPDALQRIITLFARGPISGDPVFLANEIHAEAEKRRFLFRLETAWRRGNDPTLSLDDLHRMVGVDDDTGHRNSDLSSLTSAELDAGQYDQTYLVESVLAANQPCIIAAPKKCLKTNISIDLALSLASGAKFLDTFFVPKPVRVALISGESGRATIQETARRVARSKPQIHLSDYGNALWSFDLPQLADPASVLSLRRFIRRHKLEVLVIDPAYLCLAIGDDASNLFKVGPILRVLSKLGEDEGVTIVIVHHLVKSVAVTNAPPELEGIAFAGFQEWARQWILLSRRAKYDVELPGHHELWFTAGGSAGHSVGKALDIEEGQQTDQSGRRWDVRVNSISETLDEAKEDVETRRKESQAVDAVKQLGSDVAVVINVLSNHTNGLTFTKIRNYGKVDTPRTHAALAVLKSTGRAIECKVRGGNKRSYDGWKLSSGDTGSHRENTSFSRSPGPSRASGDTPGESPPL